MSGKKIHFMGIGGVGMAGLAVLLKSRGNEVSGCDLHVSARTRWLEAQGIPVAVGHSPRHVEGVDELVVTPAVAADNPEWTEARRQVVCRYRGEVLAELVGSCDSIAVCGSHGKTTTSTWIAKLLLALGENVAWCIGGETGSFPVAGVGRDGTADGRWEPPPVLVVEADESDGTLALYHAKTLVVNKCEYDHPDHFKTEKDYFACYETARRQADTVIESENLGWEPFDCSDGSVVRLKDSLRKLPLHNQRNARAAVEVALLRGHRLEAIAEVLPSVVTELPDRRFQTVWPPEQDVGRSNGLRVITDYAHHPTEMKCAVEMARQICVGKLRVLFQPHRYSRTKALLSTFPRSFAGADEIVLCPTYAAFEQPVEGGDVADLYAACRREFASDGPVLYLARSCDEAWEHARNSMESGDVTLLLGAGDIIKLVPRVLADLGSPSAEHPVRRIWLGMGSNTWKSDLKLNVEYAKTTGPAGRPGASLLSDPQVGPLIPWMAGIPGTVGGWIKMNAGAFGHSISEAVEAVRVDGRWIPSAACGFAYRHSDLDGEIQDVRFKSAPTAETAAGPTAADCLARRRKFPAHTWGSVFKNPPGDFAGRLLEEAGAKSLRVGGATVWTEHANVIVAGDGATSSDVLALARLMAARVFHRFGVRLDPEVCGLSV